MTTPAIYATVEEFMQGPDVRSADPIDDTFIERLLEGSSRAIDLYCGGRWFYAVEETRYFDLPADRQLDFFGVNPLLSLTTLTNGDGVAIEATDYQLVKRGRPPYFALRLNQTSSVIWQPDADNNSEQVIALAGMWGWVDRSLTTDPRSSVFISTTRDICLETALNVYRKRRGEQVEGVARVTAVGVVVTPSDIPAESKRKLDNLIPSY